MNEPKLYVVVRGDLPPGAQGCQAVHAALAFQRAQPDLFRGPDELRNLALLAAPDEAFLGRLLERAAAAGVPAAPFHEEDLGGSLTAVAFGPAMQRLVSSLPKALREPRARPASAPLAALRDAGTPAAPTS